MSVTSVGVTLSQSDKYSVAEQELWDGVYKQINLKFPTAENLLINMTWFGHQFEDSEWYTVLEFKNENRRFDNIFFLATVDPPYLNVNELQEVKNMVGALHVYYLGNFDSPHQFNFFAPLLSNNFKAYTGNDLLLVDINHLFVNYNRKPKPHRLALVQRFLSEKLNQCGIVTIGTDETSDLYLNFKGNSEDKDHDIGNYGMPMVYYDLGPLEVWKHTFLYVNAATEFNPINDLFCQQDVFKPLIGMRPFVINGVQKTYRWLRYNGFKTFNQYWEHIDIEDGDVHDTIIELIEFLGRMDKIEIMNMYNDMLPDLQYNQQRFYEFAKEQKIKMENLF